MCWLNLSESTLNITNGDCAVSALKEAGVFGDFLPWRDVLHIGPLLPGKIMGRFEQSRVLFLSQYFGLTAKEVSEKFKSRQLYLTNLSRYQTIRLWFEHDLYDQLQLIQVLAYLSENCELQKVRWIVTDRYLGTAHSNEVHELFRFDQVVPESCWDQASGIWQALTDDSPERLEKLKFEQIDDWSFIVETFDRLKKEFPDQQTGLSRTQFIILSILSTGPMSGMALFDAYGKHEWALFMGDAVFEKELVALFHAKYPLLIVEKINQNWGDGIWSLTPIGETVLAGNENHVKLNGIDKWIGGVHLKESRCWWFNKEKNQLESRHEIPK